MASPRACTSAPIGLTLTRSRYLRAPVISGLSQLLGLVQIALLTRATDTGIATDAYFLLFGFALLPSQILVAGVWYPMLINKVGTTPRTHHLLRVAAPSLVVVAVLGGTVLLALRDRLPANAELMVPLLITNGMIAVSLWFDALWLAARGRATWFAGVALPANAFACVALALPWTTLDRRVVAMLVGLVVGNALLWLYFRVTRMGPRSEQLPTGTGSARSSASWFLAKSASGHVGLNLVQALALTLPASSVTILSILTRVVGSTSTTAINALMPTLVNANQSSREPALRFLWLVSAPLTAALVVTSVVSAVLGFDPVTYAAVGIGWVIAASGNAVAQRLAYRFLDPAASRVSIVVMFAILAVLGVAAATGTLSLPILVVGCVTIEAVTAMALLWVLNAQNSTVLIFIAWCLTVVTGLFL